MRKTASAHFRYSPSSAVDELVQRRRDARHDRRAAADADLEALDAVALAGDERDVVDAGQRAVGVGAAVNAVLTLRGISCVVGWRTK